MSRKSQKKQNERKPKKGQPAIDWSELSLPEINLLLYTIARWLTEGKNEEENDGAKTGPMSCAQIAKELNGWRKKNLRREAYNSKRSIPLNWPGRQMEKMVRKKYIKLGHYVEQELVEELKRLVCGLSGCCPEVIVAPDKNELLRYVWEDLDEQLKEAIEKAQAPVILGVSGGRTMLSLAQKVAELDLTLKTLSAEKRKRLIVCSLTSGGIPSDVGALSDSVAGMIATSLGVDVHGLLGPAWFPGKEALRAFEAHAYVKEHKDRVQSANFIVTSVGSLRDPNALMAHLMKSQSQEAFLTQNPDLADVLYCGYDGQTGKPIGWPDSVKECLLKLVDIEKLQAMVKNAKQHKVIVVASGKEKGHYALPGILKGLIATHVYMDKDCAYGLRDQLEKQTGERGTPKEPRR